MAAKAFSWAKIGAALALLTLTPLSFSPAGGVEENQVCAGPDSGGQCVREPGSVCLGGGETLWDHYYDP